MAPRPCALQWHPNATSKPLKWFVALPYRSKNPFSYRYLRNNEQWNPEFLPSQSAGLRHARAGKWITSQVQSLQEVKPWPSMHLKNLINEFNRCLAEWKPDKEVEKAAAQLLMDEPLLKCLQGDVIWVVTTSRDAERMTKMRRSIQNSAFAALELSVCVCVRWHGIP